MRIEVFYRDTNIDGRAQKWLKALNAVVSSKIKAVALADVYLTNSNSLTKAQAVTLFSDKVAQRVKIDEPACDQLLPEWNYLIEITYKPGVTNPVAITAKKAIESELEKPMQDGEVVQTATQYIIQSQPLTKEEENKPRR